VKVPSGHLFLHKTVDPVWASVPQPPDARDLDAAKARCERLAGDPPNPRWTVYPPGLDMPVRGQGIVLSLAGTSYQVQWHVDPEPEGEPAEQVPAARP
jgi:hypothetical protein